MTAKKVGEKYVFCSSKQKARIFCMYTCTDVERERERERPFESKNPMRVTIRVGEVFFVGWQQLELNLNEVFLPLLFQSPISPVFFLGNNRVAAAAAFPSQSRSDRRWLIGLWRRRRRRHLLWSEGEIDEGDFLNELLRVRAEEIRPPRSISQKKGEGKEDQNGYFSSVISLALRLRPLIPGFCSRAFTLHFFANIKSCPFPF